MKTPVLTPGGFELRDVPRPGCGAGEVLVRAIGCGVCAGDVTAYAARATVGPDGAILGHEASGIVVEIGAGVDAFAAGDAVTALGGSYGEYFVVPDVDLVRLPAAVDPRWALGEPIACCVHAMNRTRPADEQRVAVVGCGFMGLVCMQLARDAGAGFACAIDPIAWRRDAAGRLGADAAHDPADLSAEALIEKYGPFDVVIEAAGAQAALDLCGQIVAQHGRMNIVGYHTSAGGLRTVNMQQWNYKAIEVVNGHIRRSGEKRQAMREGIDLLAAGRLSIEPLVGYYPASRTDQAFGDLLARKEGLFKAVIVPDGADESGGAP